jgi:hypothetical protein
MKNTLFAILAILLISFKTSLAEPSSPFCYEFKDGEKIMVPVTETKVIIGVIVLSDRNKNRCERLYLMLIADPRYFNHPFFIHYNDVLPYKGK